MSVCSLSLPPIEIKLIQFDQEPNHIQRRINCKLILIVVVQNANTNKKKLKKKTAHRFCMHCNTCVVYLELS